MKTISIGPSAITAIQDFALSSLFNETNCVIVYKTDGNYQSWVPGRSLNAFTNAEVGIGYIAIMNEALDVTDYFSDGIVPAGQQTHFYFSNLTGNSIDIVKGSDHAVVVQTVANNGIWVAELADFEGEDDLSIIPNGTDYKASLIQTNFSGTTSTLKYQVAGAGIQQIPAFYLNYGDFILEMFPDASGAGTWT